MASLIFGAAYLTYDKIKTKREEKKERKRKAYADRYSELEKEHAKDTEKQLQHQRTGDSHREAELPSSPNQTAALQDRRSSSESLRSGEEKPDSPSTWVDEVISERSGGGTQSAPRSGHEEARTQSLV